LEPGIFDEFVIEPLSGNGENEQYGKQPEWISPLLALRIAAKQPEHVDIPNNSVITDFSNFLEETLTTSSQLTAEIEAFGHKILSIRDHTVVDELSIKASKKKFRRIAAYAKTLTYMTQRSTAKHQKRD